MMCVLAGILIIECSKYFDQSESLARRAPIGSDVRNRKNAVRKTKTLNIHNYVVEMIGKSP